MSVSTYINYHRKPFQQFLSIADYNERHGSSIPANQAFESAFQSALADARRVTDPHDYIQHHFNVEKMKSMSARGLSNKHSKNYGGGIGSSARQTGDSGIVAKQSPEEIEKAINDGFERGDAKREKESAARRAEIRKKAKQKQEEARAKGGIDTSSREPWTRGYEVNQKVYVRTRVIVQWKEGKVRSKTDNEVVVRFEDGRTRFSNSKDVTIDDQMSIQTEDEYNDNEAIEAAERRKQVDLDAVAAQTAMREAAARRKQADLDAVAAQAAQAAARELAAQEEAIRQQERASIRKDQGQSTSKKRTDLVNAPIAVSPGAGKATSTALIPADIPRGEALDKMAKFLPSQFSTEGMGASLGGFGTLLKGFLMETKITIRNKLVPWIQRGVRTVGQLSTDEKAWIRAQNDDAVDQILALYGLKITDFTSPNPITSKCLFLAQVPVTKKRNKKQNDLSGGAGRLPWREIESVDKLNREVERVVGFATNNAWKGEFRQVIAEFDAGFTMPEQRILLFATARRNADRLRQKFELDNPGVSEREYVGKPRKLLDPTDAFDSLDAALEGEYDDETLPAASSAAPQAVPSTPAVAPAAPAPKAPSLHEEINAYLRTGAKDESAFERDRAHVVHFNTTSMNLPSRLMKGRDRYMKRLQAYVDGDASAKVRMMDNKEVLVSSLKPTMASLKKMLVASSGAPRFCDCA